MQILSSRLILRPRDYPATLAFYRDALGLAVYREYPGGTVFFAGQGLLEVAAHGAAGGGFTGALWLQVRDVQDAAAELASKGVAVEQAPRTEPWGLVEMWVRDPDGTPVVLVEVPADHPLRRDTRPSPGAQG